MRLARWLAAVALSVVLLSVTCAYTTGWQEGKRHSTIREKDHFVRTMTGSGRQEQPRRGFAVQLSFEDPDAYARAGRSASTVAARHAAWLGNVRGATT
jgi:hypothetical protein